MSLFKREVPVEIIFDDVKFQQIATQIQEMVSNADAAISKLVEARKEVEKATKELNKSVEKMKVARTQLYSAPSRTGKW